MSHLGPGLPRTLWVVRPAVLRRSALAAIAIGTSVGVIGCGSSSTDTAKATALFRQIVERQYDIRAGHCVRATLSRWACTARINEPPKLIDVILDGTVTVDDGQLSVAGHTAVL